MLIGAKGAGLLEQTIHQRGLAMVDVRDDRDVSNVLHQYKSLTVKYLSLNLIRE
jgi:hypothetical protein